MSTSLPMLSLVLPGASGREQEISKSRTTITATSCGVTGGPIQIPGRNPSTWSTALRVPQIRFLKSPFLPIVN